MLHIVHLFTKCTERTLHSLAAKSIQHNNTAAPAEEISIAETWSLVDIWPLWYNGHENVSSTLAK
jgi:hypothetical protein